MLSCASSAAQPCGRTFHQSRDTAGTVFQHISILQGTKVYGVHLHPIPIPARERDARKDHDNFFFDHEDYVRRLLSADKVRFI